MLAIFESILPIFLLVAAGNLLRRLPLIEDSGWPGMEQLAYWFLYPALLFVTVYNADFSGLRLDAMVFVLLLTLAVMCGGTLALWPALRRHADLKAPEFSSIFQTAIRWNAFMALAIAQKMFPAQGGAVVALVMAIIILPVNLTSVAIVSRFSPNRADWPSVLRSMALNPIVLASFAAVSMRFLPFPIYEPVNGTLRLVGDAALGLGLLTIGAGLRLRDLIATRVAVWLPVVIKLLVFPVVMVALAIAIGLSANQVQYLALCAAVPTAMNGYILARQLGGDAELYAAIATLQTMAAFFSIPLVLTVTAQLSSG